MAEATEDRRPLVALVCLWTLTYLGRGWLGHASLTTSAWDLSVFDYTLDGLRHGRIAVVPFMGQSLFSHHFMPTLAALVPAYAVWPSPVTLILIQTAAMAVAAVLLWKLMPGRLPTTLRLAIVVTFLFSRGSHSAVTSYFYVECLEPALVFGFVLAWRRGAWRWYWPLVVVALGCKEDVSLYVGTFGLAMALRGDSRRAALGTVAVAGLWLAVAVGVAIPTARRWDGLPVQNPFVEARYGDSASGYLVPSAARVVSADSLKVLARMTAGVAGACWLGAEWLLIAAPGLVFNLAAKAGTQQARLLGHYLWPIMPWLYLAVVVGAERLAARGRRVAPALAALLLLITVADTPLWSRLASVGRTPWSEASTVRSQLRAIPADASLLAMSNLIPHVPRRTSMCALLRDAGCGGSAQYVALSTVGDLWPLTLGEVQARIAAYRADPRYAPVTEGPLYVFRRRP